MEILFYQENDNTHNDATYEQEMEIKPVFIKGNIYEGEHSYVCEDNITVISPYKLINGRLCRLGIIGVLDGDISEAVAHDKLRILAEEAERLDIQPVPESPETSDWDQDSIPF